MKVSHIIEAMEAMREAEVCWIKSQPVSFDTYYKIMKARVAMLVQLEIADLAVPIDTSTPGPTLVETATARPDRYAKYGEYAEEKRLDDVERAKACNGER